MAINFKMGKNSNNTASQKNPEKKSELVFTYALQVSKTSESK